MRIIAIPIEEDKGLNSQVASSCGSGKFFLVCQVEGQKVIKTETHQAPHTNCSRWQCRDVEFVQTLGCNVFITPRMGKPGLKSCAEADIDVVLPKEGNAGEALNGFLAGHTGLPSIQEHCPFSHEGMFTAAAHAGGVDAKTGSVMPPIYQTSTFAFENAMQGANRFAGKEEGYIYTRMGNPTIRVLEDTVAALEGGWGGLATSTGMAAVVAVYMTLLGKDCHIVGTDCLYGPSRCVIERDFSRFGVESSFVDTTHIENVRNAIRPNTKMLYIETPANPTIGMTDIAACAEIAHQHKIPLVVDNTFMSPYLQRPFELGADIIIHSMTKFLNGHSDVVAGIIVPKTQELYKALYKVLIYHGGTMDPHQAYLVLRGIKTLPLRMERCQENAVKMAELLEAHPKITRVLYPGLKSHPQYELGKRQMRGPGAVMSFEVKGGLEAGRNLIDHVHVPTLAVSLGGVESLISHPASMTHAGIARENREKAGITDGLIRFSVGCEDYQDLKDDMLSALQRI